jgi:hypothetical protein
MEDLRLGGIGAIAKEAGEHGHIARFCAMFGRFAVAGDEFDEPGEHGASVPLRREGRRAVLVSPLAGRIGFVGAATCLGWFRIPSPVPDRRRRIAGLPEQPLPGSDAWLAGDGSISAMSGAISAR